MKKWIVACAGVGVVVWLLARDESQSLLPLSWSTRRRLSGALGEFKGKGEQTVGKVAGDSSLQAKGVVDEALGGLEGSIGRAVDAAKDLAAS